MARASKKHTPTDEQQEAIDLSGRGETLKIIAYAGTGKTSTLTYIAEEKNRRVRSQGRADQGVYLAFNRSVADSAAKKFPSNVSARTFHSLAYQAVGYQFRERLQMRANGRVVADHLGLDGLPLGDRSLSPQMWGQYLLQVVGRFCRTMDPVLDLKHCPNPDFEGITPEYELELRRSSVRYARRLFDEMSDPKGKLPTIHDIYVRLWATSNPKIETDFILFDEAQDADPLMMAVIDNQSHAQRIWVGDPYQQIYSWRGAVNAMSHITGKETYLTRSFRFGKAIADRASILLRALGAKKPLQGNPKKKSTLGLIDGLPDMVLSRSNKTMVGGIMAFIEKGHKVTGTGVQESYQFLKQAEALKNGRNVHGSLSLFKSWEELVDYSETEQGQDLKVYVDMIKTYGIPDLLRWMEKALNTDDRDADVRFSTAHRAKGLEWNQVKISSDFRMPATDPKTGLFKLPPEEEVRLLYVACTRAQVKLDDEHVFWSLFELASH